MKKATKVISHDATPISQATDRSTESIVSRRALVAGTALAGAAATMPDKWATPVIRSVVLPAHAATSALTIADIAVGAAPEFTTLVGALSTAGLVSTLQGPGPFTVFAPTNAAFSAISGVVAGLSVAQLTDVLLYHVVPGINPPSAIPSTSGTPANITSTINASNGVIYVIDQVLLP